LDQTSASLYTWIPNLSNNPILLQVDAGIEKELVFGDPKAPRYVWWEKKLRPTPSGPDALTFDLLTIAGKIRAGLGALGFKKGAPGDITPSPSSLQSPCPPSFSFSLRTEPKAPPLAQTSSPSIR